MQHCPRQRKTYLRHEMREEDGQEWSRETQAWRCQEYETEEETEEVVEAALLRRLECGWMREQEQWLTKLESEVQAPGGGATHRESSFCDRGLNASSWWWSSVTTAGPHTRQIIASTVVLRRILMARVSQRTEMLRYFSKN